MHTRTLGRTGLEVGVLSIGTEHLLHQPQEVVSAVVGAAVEGGVNYLDVVFSHPDYLDRLGAAFRGRRAGLILTGHLGSTVYKGQYQRSDNPKLSETFFLDLLARLGTDHVDLLFLHNYNTLREWEATLRPGGRLDLAQRLRREGKARFIAIGGHSTAVMLAAVDSGLVDVVMFPVNLMGHAQPGRVELLNRCVQQGIGLVAMKPYGGGRLLTVHGTFRVPKYQSGGEPYNARIRSPIVPAQCLAYTLAQPGVSTALAGVKDLAELRAALAALDAGVAERDFGGLLAEFGRAVEGECVYCNHCLPCPASIDIAAALRLLDAAQASGADSWRTDAATLAVAPSACTECGACEGRCPFGVPVIARMRQATALFCA